MDERGQGMQMESASWQAHRPSLSCCPLLARWRSVQCGRIATRTLHTITIPRSNTTHSTPRWLVDLAIRWAVCHRHPCPRWQSAPSPTPSECLHPTLSLHTVLFACLPLAPALQLHIDVNSRVVISFTCSSHFQNSSSTFAHARGRANLQALFTNPAACAAVMIMRESEFEWASRWFKYGDSLCMI